MAQPPPHIENTDSFGCPQCYHAIAEAMWKAIRTFELVKELVDESHFRVVLIACSACGQRWVKVFAESIDWEKGEDPQYWALLPLTAAEAGRLAVEGDAVGHASVESLAPGRRRLEVYNPKEGPQTIEWASGPMVIMPHD